MSEIPNDNVHRATERMTVATRKALAEMDAMHREYLERSEKRHAEAMASMAELFAMLEARIQERSA